MDMMDNDTLCTRKIGTYVALCHKQLYNNSEYFQCSRNTCFTCKMTRTTERKFEETVLFTLCAKESLDYLCLGYFKLQCW